MGQLLEPSQPGFTVLAIDREYGPGAGAGASGNRVIMLGAQAGFNSAIANAIIIGNASGDAGITDASLNGTTIVGAQSAQALTAGDGTITAPNAALTLIGQGNLVAATKASSTVIVGANNLPLSTAGGGVTTQTSVIIGNDNYPALVGGNVATSVVIGYNTNNAQVSFGNSLNVIIGYQALNANTTSATSNVLIGANVASTLGAGGVGSPTQNVCIGASANIPNGNAAAVVVGYNASSASSGTTSIGNVVIGANAVCGTSVDTTGGNVIIGAGAKTPSATVGGKNIVIGPSAGNSLPAAGTHLFVIESNTGSQQAILYGDLSTGNLVVGNSTDAASRDLISGGTATNNLRLLNGTIAAANPASGGTLYVTAGVIHYLDQNGINSQLSMTAAGQLAGNALVAYTNNAGAQVATITNGPLAGNPTKWIPINDNGTIRNMPAW